MNDSRSPWTNSRGPAKGTKPNDPTRVGLLDEQTQLGFITRRAHMAQDPAAPIDRFGDLDRRRARSGAHSPNPGHPGSPLTHISA